MSRQTPTSAPEALSDDELTLIDKYWCAANYLSVGQIYLLDNPLLNEPLAAEHVKPRLLGHWGTTPGLNLIYAHLNRIIRNRDANVIYITGPGHGGPGLVANAYLEGTYTEIYSGIGEDTEGLRKLFRQFSFPGGIPSHVAAQTPGSIHEGGELGYALVHAFGAAFDNPDLVVACVIGDGEAETGPLAARWHSNKFLNPAVDGAVLPILHLNGYKIANPTVLARIPHTELESLMRGYSYRPITVAGDDPAAGHRELAGVADDRAAHPQGLDRAQAGRRQARRGHLARTPGAACRDPRQPRAPRAAGRVAAQAMVGHRQQRVAVRRQIDPDDLGALVGDQVDEAGILVRGAVVVLTPYVRAQQVVQRAMGWRQGSSRLVDSHLACWLSIESTMCTNAS